MQADLEELRTKVVHLQEEAELKAKKLQKAHQHRDAVETQDKKVGFDLIKMENQLQDAKEKATKANGLLRDATNKANLAVANHDRDAGLFVFVLASLSTLPFHTALPLLFSCFGDSTASG